MKAIDYINRYKFSLNRDKLTSLLADEGVEMTDELWAYLTNTPGNINYAVLKSNFGIDTEISKEGRASKNSDIYEMVDMKTVDIYTSNSSVSLTLNDENNFAATKFLKYFESHPNEGIYSMYNDGSDHLVSIENINDVVQSNDYYGKIAAFNSNYDGDVWALITSNPELGGYLYGYIYGNEKVSIDGIVPQHEYKEWLELFKAPFLYEVEIEINGQKYPMTYDYTNLTYVVNITENSGDSYNCSITNTIESTPANSNICLYIECFRYTSSIVVGFLHVKKIGSLGQAWAAGANGSLGFYESGGSIHIDNVGIVYSHSYNQWSEVVHQPWRYKVEIEVNGNRTTIPFTSAYELQDTINNVDYYIHLSGEETEVSLSITILDNTSGEYIPGYLYITKLPFKVDDDVWFYGMSDYNAFLYPNGTIEIDGAIAISHSYEEWLDIYENPWDYQIEVEVNNERYSMTLGETKDSWVYYIDDNNIYYFYIQAYNYDDDSYIDVGATFNYGDMLYVYITHIPYEGDAWYISAGEGDLSITAEEITGSNATTNHTFAEWLDVIENHDDYEIEVEFSDGSIVSLEWSIENEQWEISQDYIGTGLASVSSSSESIIIFTNGPKEIGTTYIYVTKLTD